jgi:predicted protein tyrosine phosphatase
MTETNTEKIFKLTCPYTDNRYQGDYKRVVFVCSAGLLRSATAAAHFNTTRGWNTRAAGSEKYALIPLSANLVVWAEKVVFMKKENYDWFRQQIRDNAALVREIEKKAIVLSINDSYEYNNEELKAKLEEQLDGVGI